MEEVPDVVKKSHPYQYGLALESSSSTPTEELKTPGTAPENETTQSQDAGDNTDTNTCNGKL
jgi:hypothetical protein